MIRSSEATTLIETPAETFARFVPVWQVAARQGHRVRIGEIISVVKETHRLTDEYPFHLDDRGLYMYSHPGNLHVNKKIYVRDNIKTDGYPESAEAKVYEQVEKWAKNAEEGTAVWISPAYAGKYPCSKIIIHQLNRDATTGEKMLRNSVIVFDTGEGTTLEVVHQLFPSTKDVQSLEALRPILLFPNSDLDSTEIWEEIAKLDPNVRQAKPEMSEEELLAAAKYIASLINEGVHGRQVTKEMQRMGLLGRFSISCPLSQRGGRSFSETIGFVGGEDGYGSLQFDCPACGFKNTRPYGRLIPNCTHCGASAKC